MTYTEKLQDPRWQKKRLQILERDEFKCKMCKDDTTTLHVHHKKYSGDPWEADNNDLITYCKHCHAVVEHNKKEDFWPMAVIKAESNNDIIKIIVIYIDKDFELSIDFYLYFNDTIKYQTTISKSCAERIVSVINSVETLIYKNG